MVTIGRFPLPTMERLVRSAGNEHHLLQEYVEEEEGGGGRRRQEEGEEDHTPIVVDVGPRGVALLLNARYRGIRLISSHGVFVSL